MSNRVPHGWIVSQINDTCDVFDYMRIPLNTQERALRKGRYPYYGANGVQGYIDDYIFDGEYVLLAEDGGYFDQWSTRPISYLVTGKFWVNNHAHILKAKAGHETKYVHYSLVHKNILEHINGGTRSKLNQSDMRNIEYLTPPLPEQQKIATILSSVDDVIEKTRVQIDKLKDLKTGMMQELLTKGIGHTEFKDSPVGRIPVAWDVVNIESITTDVTYGLTVRPKYIDEGVPLVSGKECKDGWLDFSISNRISEVDFASLRTRALPSVGDVIMTKTGTIGRVALVRKHYPKFAISQNVALLKPEMSQVEPEYLLLLLTSQSVKEQIRLGVSTLSVPDLQLGTLKGFIVPLPSKNEQRSISSIINSLNDRLSGCEEKLCQYGLLKKALMQDLLTGKVRVNLTDKESAVV